MRARRTPSHAFGAEDRIWWQGRPHRYYHKIKRVHTLEAEGPEEPRLVQITDDEITHAGPGFRHDPGHYSDAAVAMREMHQGRSIDDMSVSRLARAHLRAKWAKEFASLQRAGGKGGRPVVNRSTAGLRVAIQALQEPIQSWYLATFSREIEDLRVREIARVPAPATLRRIVSAYEEAGLEGVRDRWARCGRRDQIHPEVRRIVDREVPLYFSRARPKPASVIKRIRDAIETLNLGREERLPLYSQRLVRERIAKMSPIFASASRQGGDEALRAFAPVGTGVGATRPGERLEIDDLDVDLFALLCSVADRGTLSKALLDRVPRVRCTLSIAIDCGVSAVVGINLVPHAPDAATASACLRSACETKDKLALWAGCQADWRMTTRWEVVATDGGPAFRCETDERVREMTSGRKKPDQDPRMRGHVERFFKTFQDDFLAFYSGRTQANVVLRGDYDAEAMASLCFEDLYKSIVRWIVDVYHNSPHAALEGSTPSAAWHRFACDDEGIAPPLPAAEVARIFGLRRKATVTAEGFTIVNLSFNSPEVAWLHANRSDREVEVRVDPENLDSALLHVPLDVRGRTVFRGLEFISVPCVQPEARGLTLGDWLWQQEATRELHRRDVEAGAPIRITARRDLFAGGAMAMREAGIPTEALSQSGFDRITAAIDRKAVAALSPPMARRPDLGFVEPFGGEISPDQSVPPPPLDQRPAKGRRGRGRDKPRPVETPLFAPRRKSLSPRYENDADDNKGEP